MVTINKYVYNLGVFFNVKHTYLCSSNFSRNFFNLIVANIDFIEIIPVPPVVNQVQILEIDNLRRENSKISTTQIKCTSLLRTFQSTFQSFLCNRTTFSCSNCFFTTSISILCWWWSSFRHCNLNAKILLWLFCLCQKCGIHWTFTHFKMFLDSFLLIISNNFLLK